MDKLTTKETVALTQGVSLLRLESTRLFKASQAAERTDPQEARELREMSERVSDAAVTLMGLIGRGAVAMGPSTRRAIQAALITSGNAARYSPTHVEAFMRLQHPTLDGLSYAAFQHEVEIARQCIDASTPAEAAALAASFGLRGDR